MVDKTATWGLKNKSIAPGSMKTISDTKLKAFEEGTMMVGKKGMSKREQDEMRKKEDQKAAAAVYEEFVASFAESSKQGKHWVKGETVNSDKGGSSKSEKSRIYKPQSKLAELASTFQSVKSAHKEESSPPSKFSTKKKPDERKKKSNLEMFKEELKRIQEEREERHRMKRGVRGGGGDPGGGGGGDYEERRSYRDPEDILPVSDISLSSMYDQSQDETSTNIYVGNINPKMSEKQLLELFGKYGPLASVKIMWPRTDEEKSRGRNCGFVAFMNRHDGERALKYLKGKEIHGFEMKLGWGKPVPIPPHPVYIPPALAELTLPPPPSGLPFNAQPNKSKRARDYKQYSRHSSNNKENLEETLSKAVVKVVIPTERFLFDNQSPAHIYYRWKLFSILNGDQPYKWRMDEYRMFRRGSYWKPPPMNPYTQGMPEELVDTGDNDISEAEPKDDFDPTRKGKLTDSQRDRLEDMLRELTPERSKVGEAMVWCLDHADSAEEVVECIAESLSILQTPIPKKIARLFLVSDILFNSSAKVPNASHYRKQFQRKLNEIFRDVHDTYDNIDGRLKAEQFKQKVMLCFRAWEDWAIYPNDTLINLQNIFLGLVPKEGKKSFEEPVKVDVDGIPMTEVDLDGAPLEEVEPRPVLPNLEADDFDGAPLTEDLDGDPIGEAYSEIDGKPLDLPAPQAQPQKAQLKFAQSKWESVDETELEAQAMTTSKWDLLETEDGKADHEEDLDGMPIEDDNLDGQEMSDGEISEDQSQESPPSRQQSQEMTEERRRKLREIEVKVMKYQDELEAGRRSRKPNMSMGQQIEHHRKKLLAKEFDDSPARESRKRHRSGSPGVRYEEKYRSYEDSPKRKRAKSPKKSRRSRSRSRSPRRRSRSHSPSRQRRKSKKSKHRD